ncbi:MAG TPA: SBBP repeat-containing protein, partial [Bacteroidales bacterium]|nr:SBBP repeat-containing protein [Bacteroidales bacterium]
MKLTVTYLLIITLLIPLGIKADVLSDSVNCHHSIALAWVNKAGSDTADAATGVCSDSDGNVYITGYFGHSINFESIELISQGQRDVFIAKYNIDGEFQWAISAGGSGDDYGNAIACDDEGNTYITGMFTDFALFGNIELYAYGQQDAFIASFDNQGNLRWAEAAGGWENDRGIDIVVDNQNNVFVTGIFDDALGIGSTTLLSNGNNDVFIGCFSSMGVFKWGKNIGSIGSDEATAIAVDASGRAFVSGVFTGNLIS